MALKSHKNLQKFSLFETACEKIQNNVAKNNNFAIIAKPRFIKNSNDSLALFVYIFDNFSKFKGLSMETLKAHIDLIIIALLGVMAFIALYCVIERLLFFRKVKASAYQNQDDFDNALSENLTTLYIIYSNAPYVGLLGTVLGIMIVFYDMGISGNIDVKSIVIGLSLALKATALGLVVAIPSLMAYNALLRKVSLLSSKFKGER